MNKKWLAGGVAVVMVVAALTGAAWLSGRLPSAEARVSAQPEVALEFAPREVVQPALARLPAVLEFSGPLVARQSALVRAKTGGTLLALTVTEGSCVTAGQVLGRIDGAELASRVAEREANLESARTTLAQAERTRSTNERLAAQQFISPIALDTSRAALETARAALNAAQAALQTTRLGLRDVSLVAPIPGIVARRFVLPGEKLSAEQQVLSIVDLALLELAGSVGTHEVSRLEPGTPVQVTVEGAAAPVAGRITRIAPAAEPGTRSIAVSVTLPNPNERLRAGQYAVARATLADDAERLTVPLAAVGSSGGQDHVWVVESGVLARRAITLGRRDDREGRVEVLTGLGPDSTVLAARFDNLREGTRARVAEAAAASSASPARQ